MRIIKRTGVITDFDVNKIMLVISYAFKSAETLISDAQLTNIVQSVVLKLENIETNGNGIRVEDVQDQVEKTLIEQNYYNEVKKFILYRDERAKKRQIREKIANKIPDCSLLVDILLEVEKEFLEDEYNLLSLKSKFLSFIKDGMTSREKLSSLTKAALELTTQEAPNWEYIAARFLMLQFNLNLQNDLIKENITSFFDKIKYLTDKGLYGSYILENYTKEEIDLLEKSIDNKRNKLLTYSSLDMLLRRYVVRSLNNHPLETPQEMFMGIAMHLAMKEDNDKLGWVIKFYDMLSNLKVTMATPTLSNARKPYHQLSSCFIDTVPDDLIGIYRSISNFAQVSKFGGGMGMYLGKVRASGSSIRGFQGASGGIVRWIKMINDTAVAVDQLGVRQGAVAVYLDIWHKDLPEFLQLRTNNGDDRMKAHDIFPAICYPDYFWRLVKENINDNWYFMCPHEVKTIKGYSLEDFYGDEWEIRYKECIDDIRINKRMIPLKDIVRLIIKSGVETGTPFTFNRDHVNNANPNKHKGIIYCSNLCTEIAQNMSGIESVSQTVENENGDIIVVTKTKPGDFVVCNLASLSLGNIDVKNEKELESIISSVVRALDNVIDLNFYPLPYAELTNQKYRPIGLGVSGYHHMLAKLGIAWETQEHLDFVDKLFENINYFAIKASNSISKEKGCYDNFIGSDWHNGNYFAIRNYNSNSWNLLKGDIKKDGLRNGYIMAIAPTSSTSIIAGTTAGLDPIMDKYFLEEKKTGLMPRVAPNLNSETFWIYKNAHLIDQSWIVKAAGVRGRHVDQAQSLNIYITNDYSFRQLLDIYLLAWEQGVKTLYYIRSKSLEVEECDVCSS